MLLLKGVLGDLAADENGEKMDLKNFSDKPFFGFDVMNERLLDDESEEKNNVATFLVPDESIDDSSLTGFADTIHLFKD